MEIKELSGHHNSEYCPTVLESWQAHFGGKMELPPKSPSSLPCQPVGKLYKAGGEGWGQILILPLSNL